LAGADDDGEQERPRLPLPSALQAPGRFRVLRLAGDLERDLARPPALEIDVGRPVGRARARVDRAQEGVPRGDPVDERALGCERRALRVALAAARRANERERVPVAEDRPGERRALRLLLLLRRGSLPFALLERERREPALEEAVLLELLPLPFDL